MSAKRVTLWREEYGLRVFGNKLLKEMFVSKKVKISEVFRMGP
jgi:hypothetical protein